MKFKNKFVKPALVLALGLSVVVPTYQSISFAADTKVEETKEVKDLIEVDVNEVVDGDTIKVRMPDGNEETVRFVLVNTPETKHPQKGEEYFGKEASEYTKKLIEENGNKVYLEKDTSERDKYDRLLRYVWLKPYEGVAPTKVELRENSLNGKLVYDGYARVSPFPPDTLYISEFKENEEIARANGYGMWKDEEKALNIDAGQPHDEETAQVHINSTDERLDKKYVADSGDGQIKAIKSEDGKKIYYLPHYKGYDDIKVDFNNGGHLYKTEREALEAGFTPFDTSEAYNTTELDVIKPDKKDEESESKDKKDGYKNEDKKVDENANKEESFFAKDEKTKDIYAKLSNEQKEELGKIDANNDGKITEEELTAQGIVKDQIKEANYLYPFVYPENIKKEEENKEDDKKEKDKNVEIKKVEVEKKDEKKEAPKTETVKADKQLNKPEEAKRVNSGKQTDSSVKGNSRLAIAGLTGIAMILMAAYDRFIDGKKEIREL